MKRILLAIILELSFNILSGQDTTSFKSIDVYEFAELVSTTQITLLDVRTSKEHSEGHIPGTHHNIDVLSIDFEVIVENTLDKDKPVALYCRSGNRSKKAAQILSSKGFTVIELSTGFKGWATAGKAVSTPKE